MTIYVVLMFLSILVGMAISVKAFGTGGKRAKVFEDIYFSVEDVEGIGIVYTKSGDYSALMDIENPVQKYSADTDSYYDYQQLFTKICQSLGEGYILQKQDVFIRKRFDSSPSLSVKISAHSNSPISAISTDANILRSRPCLLSLRKIGKADFSPMMPRNGESSLTSSTRFVTSSMPRSCMSVSSMVPSVRTMLTAISP